MKTFAVLSQLLLMFLGIFLMIVVLLQRGRGGGLAGAFGGLGGQSAFGTKAGDVFTKITVVIAVCWVLVAGGSGFVLRSAESSRSQGLGSGTVEEPAASSLDGEESGSGLPSSTTDGGGDIGTDAGTSSSDATASGSSTTSEPSSASEPATDSGETDQTEEQ